MKNIAQKSSSTNMEDFLYSGVTKDYIDGICFNIAFTEDNRLVAFNASSLGEGTINTIETSTLSQLQNYEIILLDDLLQRIDQKQFTKEIYLNLYPLKSIVLTDENIEAVTKRMNDYVEMVKQTIEKFPNLLIYLHCVNRGIVTKLKEKITNNKIGFVIYGDDLNFIDVDYYVILMNAFSDAIIDLLHKRGKNVLLYLSSDYYINYTYEHYLGEKSTPYLQEEFQKIGIISNYPEVIHKVFHLEG